MPSQLALQKQLELRRRSLPQRQLALSENILLQRRIRQAAAQSIEKAQREHIQSHLSSLGYNNAKVTQLRRERLLASLGLDEP